MTIEVQKTNHEQERDRLLKIIEVERREREVEAAKHKKREDGLLVTLDILRGQA